jgi:hypothetical protein
MPELPDTPDPSRATSAVLSWGHGQMSEANVLFSFAFCTRAVQDIIQTWQPLTDDVVQDRWDSDEEWEVKQQSTRSVFCREILPPIGMIIIGR